MVVHVSSEKWPEVWIYTASWAVTDCWASGLGTCKKQDCKTGNKAVWGRDMCVHGLLCMGTNSTNIYAPQESPPTGIFYWREASCSSGGQNDTLWQVSYFLQPPWCLLNGPLNKVAVAAGMEAMHGLNNVDLPSLRLTWLTLLLSA